MSNYKAPEAEVGDPVLWYTDANTTQRPSVGFVIQVDGNAVDIITLDENLPRRRFEVHHLTDPVLKVNHEIRRNGGWKLNPKFAGAATTAAEMAALRKRLEHIEKELGIAPEVVVAQAPQVSSTAPQIVAAADVGLTNVVFAEQGAGKEIRGGVVVEPEMAQAE